MDEYIKEIGNNLNFEKNSFNDFGNGLLLTNYEIDILDKYGINYKDCINLKSLIIKIEAVLEENDYENIEDLDYISTMIAERDYYQNTNK